MRPLQLQGPMHFRLRFNTKHGNTNLYWRIFINDEEYLVSSIQCEVPTHSDTCFDEHANEQKYNIAGYCNEFIVDEDGAAVLR